MGGTSARPEEEEPSEDYPYYGEAITVLGLYPGVRATGWAVLVAATVAATGAALAAPSVLASGQVSTKTQRKMQPSDRIACQLETLSVVAARWRPGCVARSTPAVACWRLPGLVELESAFREWAESIRLPLMDYHSPAVRAAVAGRPNASADALAYATMQRSGLIGQRRTSSEWEAIAAACHHLQVMAGQPGCTHPHTP